MSPARREIAPDEAERLANLRAEAARGREALLDQAPPPEDPLGRVAWMAGVDGNPLYPFNNDLREAINTARDARYQWREISTALGDGDDQATADRVNAKQLWRNKTYDEFEVGDDNPGVG